MTSPKDFSVESHREIILASASPRRRELMLEAGFTGFRVIPSHAEEDDSPLDNALRKAEDVAQSYPDALVIGADTVIRLGRTVIGKPADEADAVRILSFLSGKTHEVVTGVCVRCLASDICVRYEVSTAVEFRTLSPEIIAEYLRLVPVLDKAGAYAIQEHGDLIISSISGSRSNVIGLPMEQLGETLRYLRKLG